MNHSKKIKKELLSLVSKEHEIIVFDTETTGLDPATEQIIQFSALKGSVRKENGIYKFIETARIDEYIKPNKKLPTKIVEITKITDEMLKDKPTEDVIFEKISDFMGENPIISGYNVNFDIGMLSALYTRRGAKFNYSNSFDVMAMARELVSKDDLINAGLEPRFKQENIARLYDIADGVQFHSAIEDTKVCASLLASFVGEYEQEKEEPKHRLKIRNIYRETRYQHDRNGIWVIGDTCNVFYSDKYHQWYCTSSEDAKKEAFENIDLDLFIQDVLNLTGLSSVEELKNYTGNYTDKSSLREAKAVTNLAFWAKYSLRRIYFIASDDKGQTKGFYDLDEKKYSCPGFNLDSIKAIAEPKILKMRIE